VQAEYHFPGRTIDKWMGGTKWRRGTDTPRHLLYWHPSGGTHHQGTLNADRRPARILHQALHQGYAIGDWGSTPAPCYPSSGERRLSCERRYRPFLEPHKRTYIWDTYTYTSTNTNYTLYCIYCIYCT